MDFAAVGQVRVETTNLLVLADDDELHGASTNFAVLRGQLPAETADALILQGGVSPAHASSRWTTCVSRAHQERTAARRRGSREGRAMQGGVSGRVVTPFTA